jgi:endonuclease YncB( thermonuclease family)
VRPNYIARFVARLLVALAATLCSLDLVAADKEWTTLENCQLIPNPDNDGDSFHIRAGDTEYLVRLYMVDAPETKGGQMAGRLIEQANYFGLSVPQVIQVGEDAKLFVERKLAQPFTVQTKKASGLGRSKIERFYGFVQTSEGDLGQLLVANGLARVHGTHTTRPGATSSAEELEKLQQLEIQAKQSKLGGWSQTVGTTAPVLQQTPTAA